MTKVRWPLASISAVICAAALCFSLQSVRSIAAEDQSEKPSASDEQADLNDSEAKSKDANKGKSKKANKKEVAPKKPAKGARQSGGSRTAPVQRGNGARPTAIPSASGSGSNTGSSGQTAKPTSNSSGADPDQSNSTEANPGNVANGRAGGKKQDAPMLPGDAPYPKDVQKVLDIQNKHSMDLLKTKGINGVSTGLSSKTGKPVIKVTLTGADNPKVPETIEGVPVETEIVGPIFDHYSGFAGSDKYSPQVRLKRPIAIGVSGINFTGCDSVCSTGTIGCRLRAKDGSVYALSNNHVFADNNLAAIGSLVVQPGPADNSCQCIAEDEVGTLFKFKTKDFNGGLNRMDAAVMKTTEDLVSNRTLPDGYGIPRTYTVKRPQLGMKVMKYGRTTGFTKGRITGVNAFTSSIAATGQIAFYSGQIIIRGEGGTFSAGGDSGSLVVTEDRFPVGLLFSGSGNRTVANPIQEVLDEFGMEIDGDDALDFPIPGKSGKTQPNAP